MINFNPMKNIILHKKRVFLRSDLNIPIHAGQILQDFKLQSSLETINWILKKGGKIVLGTHIGQPKSGNKINCHDSELSTQILIPWFFDNGYKVEYEPDLLKAKIQSYSNQSSILLLENLRFFNGEKNYSLQFAELLADTADIYVNDAFGTIHREDTSVTLLAQQFENHERTFGLLVEREIQNLEKIRTNVSQNFVLVIGGIKLKDKFPLIKNLIQSDHAVKPKTIILGGALGLAFLNNIKIASPMLDTETLQLAQQISHLATINKINLLIPVDQIVVDAHEIKKVSIDELNGEINCVDIGPETIKIFSDTISHAEVIFCNGTMGIYTENASQTGTREILTAIANSKAFKVIGGGDATAATCMFGLDNHMDFLSTGGGATLMYLSCEDPNKQLPGLNALMDKTTYPSV